MRASARFVIVVVCAALLIVLRYILKTPQSLTSKIAGKPHFHTWSLGKIFYQVHGPLDASAIVLLHAPEIGGSSYEMRHLVPGLARHYRVYVPDLPGFGLSDRPALAYSTTTYQNFLEDFLANCVLQPAILIASGLSATYSLAFANAHPGC
jgi:pimeloyl-ACP methyl ester carboxylesterase